MNETPTPLTAAELDAIHERVQAVADACGTAAWFAYERDGDIHVEAEPDGPHIALVGQASWDGVAEKAAFIALARTDVPRLLGTVRFLTDKLADAERERDHARDELAEEKTAARSLRVEVDRLTAEVAALYITLQGRQDAVDRAVGLATQTALDNGRLRDLVAAFRDVLTLPRPDSGDGWVRYRECLAGRVAVLVGAVDDALAAGPIRPEILTATARKVATEPITYTPQQGGAS